MEKATRERLTGAVIFVAALAIVAPEMFSGRGDDAVVHEQAAPAEAGPPLATYDLAINPTSAPAGAREQPAAVADAAVIARSVPPPVTEVPEASTSLPPAAAAPAPAPVPAPAAPARAVEPASNPATPSAGGWWVQLGSFSSGENAQRLASELRARGFAIEVAQVRAAGKDMHRVRAGPVKDRDAATDLKNRIGASAREATLVAP